MDKQGTVVEQNQQFPLVKTPGKLAEGVRRVIESPETLAKELSGGRSAYYHPPSNTTVMFNPRAKDMGTIFRLDGGKAYFDGLH